MSKINPKLMPFLVGDLFFTTNNTNPATRFGGTWQLYGKGRTIVGYDPNDTDFDTIGKTGGEKTHTLTIDEMPKHRHTYDRFTDPSYFDNNGSGRLGGYYNATNNTGYEGGNQAHNNLQPYITTYIWIKTA